jgi:serine/threonine protein kinase
MESDNIFVAMEYPGHGDLSNYTATELLETDIKEIAENFLHGLKVMHEEGFTHRDIKPQVREFSLPSVANMIRISSWSGNDQNSRSGG